MCDQDQDRRQQTVALAVAATAAAEYPAAGVQCASCGNMTELSAAWILPAGYLICNGCAVPVLRAEHERRLTLIAAQDAGGELRAVAIPPALAQPAVKVGG